ncbi:adenylate kinase [Chloroflexota bacterium]
MYIVLLGPPGAGKGTQAQMVSRELNLPHISSGDIFREHFKKKTKLGQRAIVYIDKGDLVPDDITISMIEERLSLPDCTRGALLDGFPRTPAQADALSDMLLKLHGKVIAVPLIKVSEEILIERLTGRWTCKSEGHVYHEKYNSPKQAGVCDVDGSELYQREDDKVDTVTNRIQVYFDQTMPLIEYYKQKDLLIEINGDQSIKSVNYDLISVLSRNMDQGK